MNIQKNAKGFTLVEIMIVVAIIGLLAAIAVPNFVTARNNARTSTCINNMRLIDAAKEQGCDLIFMASHCRRGMSGLLLGSETLKVLTHCNIPVLVFRDEISERSFRQALEETNDFRT